MFRTVLFRHTLYKTVQWRCKFITELMLNNDDLVSGQRFWKIAIGPVKNQSEAGYNITRFHGKPIGPKVKKATQPKDRKSVDISILAQIVLSWMPINVLTDVSNNNNATQDYTVLRLIKHLNAKHTHNS